MSPEGPVTCYVSPNPDKKLIRQHQLHLKCHEIFCWEL